MNMNQGFRLQTGLFVGHRLVHVLVKQNLFSFLKSTFHCLFAAHKICLTQNCFARELPADKIKKEIHSE